MAGGIERERSYGTNGVKPMVGLPGCTVGMSSVEGVRAVAEIFTVTEICGESALNRILRMIRKCRVSEGNMLAGACGCGFGKDG